MFFLFAEENSQDSKLEFSEDEETLIIRMYNLVGERWVGLSSFSLLFFFFMVNSLMIRQIKSNYYYYFLISFRWSLIAGRIPGRTAEEIEKYWTSRYSTSE